MINNIMINNNINNIKITIITENNNISTNIIDNNIRITNICNKYCYH